MKNLLFGFLVLISTNFTFANSNCGNEKTVNNVEHEKLNSIIGVVALASLSSIIPERYSCNIDYFKGEEFYYGISPEVLSIDECVAFVKDILGKNYGEITSASITIISKDKKMESLIMIKY